MLHARLIEDHHLGSSTRDPQGVLQPGNNRNAAVTERHAQLVQIREELRGQRRRHRQARDERSVEAPQKIRARAREPRVDRRLVQRTDARLASTCSMPARMALSQVLAGSLANYGGCDHAPRLTRFRGAQS